MSREQLEKALTCDRGCGHTLDPELCFQHQMDRVQQLIDSAKREAWIKSRIDTLQEFVGNSDGISVRSGDGYADVQTEISRLQAQLKQSEESE